MVLIEDALGAGDHRRGGADFPRLECRSDPPTWGGMRRPGSSYLRLHPHLARFSGLLIMLAVLGFNAMGDAIRDILGLRMLNRLRVGRTT